MPKVNVSKVTIVSHEVDIPESCPACNADFQAGGNLGQFSLTRKQDAVHLNGAEEEPIELDDDNDDYSHLDEIDIIVTHLRCRACGQIVAGEMPEE